MGQRNAFTLVIAGFALSATVTALQPHPILPRATPSSLHRFSPDGWTPKPTSSPNLPSNVELLRRQGFELDPSFCGYLEGDSQAPLFCDYDSACLYDTEYNWFGCCTGTVIEECNLVTACVQSAKSEGEEEFVTACTEADYPACLVLQSVVSDTTYSHFECDVSQTSFEVLSTATDDASSLFFGTTEDFFTEEPSSTRERSSRATFSLDLSSSNEDETSTSEDDSSTTDEVRSSSPRTTEATVTGGGEGGFTQSAAATGSSSSTGAAPRRTGEAIVGAVGGIAGLFALL